MDELSFSAVESNAKKASMGNKKVLAMKTKTRNSKRSSTMPKKTKQVKKQQKKTKEVVAKERKPMNKQAALANQLLSELDDKAAKFKVQAQPGSRSKLKPGKPIRLGSDCAGLGSDFISLKTVLPDNVRVITKFVSEMDEVKLKWLCSMSVKLGHESPEVVYGDVTSRDNSVAPDVDIFVSGAPCPAFSTAGKRKGLADTRGWILLHSLGYAVEKQPACFILENVKGLTSKTHVWILKRIKRVLEAVGYQVFCEVLNTMEHGIPQSRPRVYLVALMKSLDC